MIPVSSSSTANTPPAYDRSRETLASGEDPRSAGRAALRGWTWTGARTSAGSTVNGSPVNVVDLGEGPALVFVHGLSGSWPNWLEQLPVFAGGTDGIGEPPSVSPGRGHRVIALDLPGFGRSPMPPEPISISGYARTLDALLEALGVMRPRSWATRWAASSPPSSRSTSPSAWSASCWSPPRASAPTRTPGAPARSRGCAAWSA